MSLLLSAGFTRAASVTASSAGGGPIWDRRLADLGRPLLSSVLNALCGLSSSSRESRLVHGGKGS